ncbi:reverse transcriptase [Tanacetum coccineum]
MGINALCIHSSALNQLCAYSVCALRTQPVCALRTQPVSALRTQLVCALRTQPVSALRTQPVCALRTQLVSALRTQLVSALRTRPPVSALRTQPVCALRTQPVSALRTQPVYALRTQLVCALRTQPVCALRTQPVCALRTQPVCALRTQPFQEVYLTVYTSIPDEMLPNGNGVLLPVAEGAWTIIHHADSQRSITVIASAVSEDFDSVCGVQSYAEIRCRRRVLIGSESAAVGASGDGVYGGIQSVYELMKTFLSALFKRLASARKRRQGHKVSEVASLSQEGEVSFPAGTSLRNFHLNCQASCGNALDELPLTCINYGGANLDRKSTAGGCQFLGRRLISWQCKKQTIVANSTTKAAYVAAANCCGQLVSSKLQQTVKISSQIHSESCKKLSQKSRYARGMRKPTEFGARSVYALSQYVLCALSQHVLYALSQLCTQYVLYALKQYVLYALSQYVLYALSQHVLYALSQLCTQYVLYALSQYVLYAISQLCTQYVLYVLNQYVLYALISVIVCLFNYPYRINWYQSKGVSVVMTGDKNNRDKSLSDVLKGNDNITMMLQNLTTRVEHTKAELKKLRQILEGWGGDDDFGSKQPTRSWPKMKRMLMGRFLLPDYDQFLFEQYQSLRQGQKSVADYTAEFLRLSSQNNLMETEGQKISRAEAMSLRGNFKGEVNRRSIVNLAEYDKNKNKYEDDFKEDDGVYGPDGGEGNLPNFIVQKVLLAPNIVDTQRNMLSRTRCTISNHIFDFIIDGGSCENIISRDLVHKMKLPVEKHLELYSIVWITDGAGIRVTKRCRVPLSIGKFYKDEVMCDVVDMNACHLLLGHPWQYDLETIHDGKDNIYRFVKDGKNITLLLLGFKQNSEPRK